MRATFDAVRRIALSLDHVAEVSSYGTPGFKVGGTLFARFHQDGKSLVLRTTMEEREELIASDPDVYFITDHYLNYPWVLVRVARIQAGALRDLLRGAHRKAASEKKRPAPRRPDR